MQGLPERYEDLGRIGVGGMAEVRRVRDLTLKRTLAMKLIHPRLVARPRAVAKFLEEAQATAQLQHPGIVPVHDLGTLPDGRVWFTMKEVQGEPLSAVLRRPGDDPAWSLRRIVSALLQVANAVSYAHARGVVHRDLKPDNILVGQHGEVLVVDWGIAKLLGGIELVHTDRNDEAHQTRVGEVTGTPAYMSPEQARGDIDAIDARSDVYALGAILYEVLSGRPPYDAPTARDILLKVRAGPPEPVGRRVPTTFGFGAEDDAPDETPPPAELAATCERAMARDLDERLASAALFADELGAWLDGARRREQALAVVADADALIPHLAHQTAEAAALRARASELLEDLEPYQPELEKLPAWQFEDQADQLDEAVALGELRIDQLLQTALRIAPDLPEAHARLAARYRDRHQAAEATREHAEVARNTVLLELHSHALGRTERAPFERYLQGDGALSLVTDPPDARVALYRYQLHHRRLVPTFDRELGTTPLVDVPLPMGSYLCLISHPDREPVRYPVSIERCARWDGVPPGETEPVPVWLPPAGSVADDEVYIPAGWFRAGGDPSAGGLPGARLWADAFVIQRHACTNRVYRTFLDALCDSGRSEEALRHAPRERGGTEGELGALIYGYEDGRFHLRPDAEGDMWLEDGPAVMVPWEAGLAYCEWLSQDGTRWTMPGELWWEKAARGVDGRWFPWGDRADPSWACIYRSHLDHPSPARVHDYEIDVSPYGVRGMGGNVRDWCIEDQRAGPSIQNQRLVWPSVSGPMRSLRVVRGGGWSFNETYARCANRNGLSSVGRYSVIGFRGMRRP